MKSNGKQLVMAAVVAAGALLTAGAVLAQEPIQSATPGACPHGGPGKGMMMGMGGAQGMTPEQMTEKRAQMMEMRAAKRTELFEAADADQDGALTLDEFIKLREIKRQRKMARKLARIDADGDGKISKEEFLNHKPMHGGKHGGNCGCMAHKGQGGCMAHKGKGMMGQGMGMKPGMMGQGMGMKPGMMGQGMGMNPGMGRGMMGQGMGNSGAAPMMTPPYGYPMGYGQMPTPPWSGSRGGWW
ncbi:EF-hand domain-containing protein [Magnetofaba australis]|uniref:Putative signal transduction protein n=1 Tax=Magnetofaba australis IT-1 TaxID=1434232 RepID=A0A1Y2JZ23_9PROT|nr:EF-hand domain-containing protein [Magnetofaba australis]OSM00155.1 putative signal transduction protein [Magnetofaba australis IT-1]